MVTASLPRHPAVQQLLPVGAAHRPVGEAGAAREEVDADSGENDGGRRDVELLRIWVWVCIQGEEGQQVILCLYLIQNNLIQIQIRYVKCDTKMFYLARCCDVRSHVTLLTCRHPGHPDRGC